MSERSNGRRPPFFSRRQRNMPDNNPAPGEDHPLSPGAIHSSTFDHPSDETPHDTRTPVGESTITTSQQPPSSSLLSTTNDTNPPHHQHHHSFMMLQDEDAARIVALQHNHRPLRHNPTPPRPPALLPLPRHTSPTNDQHRQQQQQQYYEQPNSPLSPHSDQPTDTAAARSRITTRELQSVAEQGVKAVAAIGERAANKAATIAAPITSNARRVTQQIKDRAAANVNVPSFAPSFEGRRANNIFRRRRNHPPHGPTDNDDDYHDDHHTTQNEGGKSDHTHTAPGDTMPNPSDDLLCDATPFHDGDRQDDSSSNTIRSDRQRGGCVPCDTAATATPGSPKRRDHSGHARSAADVRTVWINQPYRNSNRFPSNYIATTKYTPLNAVPKFLFEQFTRFSNAYFLFVGILFCIDAITPIFTIGRYSTLWVLAVVISISGVREAIEDIRRFRQDRRVNGTSVRIVGSTDSSTASRWDSVKVGDILKVFNKESFPADMVILASSSEDGLAFVETKQLDGESNLKVKVVPRRIAHLFATESQALLVRGRVDCETPNDRLYKFHGCLIVDSIPPTLMEHLAASGKLHVEPETPPLVGTPVTNIHQVSSADPVVTHLSSPGFNERHGQEAEHPPKILINDTSDLSNRSPYDGETEEMLRDNCPDSSRGMISSSDQNIKHIVSDHHPASSRPDSVPASQPAIVKEAPPVHSVLRSKIPLGPENLAIRGSSLRNTQWIMGLVINTGRDTKLMQNVKPRPRKNSRLERDTNRHFAISVMLQLLLVSICTIQASMYCNKMFIDSFAWYLYDHDRCTSSEFGLRFLTFFATFSGLIPISLYVSMEVVRAFQVYFIEHDLNMKDHEQGIRAEVRTSNLNEELGVVHYVFTDKTGTLTSNRMLFRKCSIANRVFVWSDCPEPGTTRTETLSERLLLGHTNNEAEGFTAEELDAGAITFRLLAICHSVVAEIRFAREESALAPSVGSVGDDGSSHAETEISGRGSVRVARVMREHNHGRGRHSRTTSMSSAASVQSSMIGQMPSNGSDIVYQASSPDEAALVAAARAHGYMFVSRSNQELVIQVNGRLEEYELLEVLEFDSSRKRMSVIVRCPNGQIRIFTKGADSVIFPRLAADQDPSATSQHLHDFAVEGLRTLCLAYADVNESYYTKWKLRYVQACALVTGREEAVAAVAEDIEKDLILLGATAIEDKLQDGVPDTLRMLEQAGVKIWVLTGDKQETAINVGLSCGALENGMEVYIINEDNLEDTAAQIDCAIGRWKALLQDPAMEGKLGLVIDGQTLTYALRRELQVKLMLLGRMARTVVACRVSPKQKTELVELVRRHDVGKVTLAIGDGANDVGMIQAAHVGVGIVGLEGQEAKLASDYSIGQFRFLARLMLVHGRWSYKRLVKMVLFTIYKNMVLVLGDMYWADRTAYSGQPFTDPWLGGIYNLFSSSLPPIILGIMDQELTADYALMFPEVYMKGQRNSAFNGRVFFSWVLSGIWHSALIFYLITKIIGERPVSNGQQLGMWALGVAYFSSVDVLIHAYAILYQSSFTWFTVVLYLVSFLSWFILGPIFSTATVSLDTNLSPALYAVVFRTFEDPRTWFVMIVSAILCCSPQLLWKYYKRQRRPNVKMLIQELIRSGRTREEITGDLVPKPLVRVPSYDPGAPPSPMNPATFVKAERQIGFSGFNFDGDEGLSLLVRRHAYANSKGVRRRRMRVLKRAGSDTELDVTGVQTTSVSPFPSEDPAAGIARAGRRHPRRFDAATRFEVTNGGGHDESSALGVHRRAMSDGAVLVEDRYERLANRRPNGRPRADAPTLDLDTRDAERESEGVKG